MYNFDELSPMKQRWIFFNSNIPRRFIGLEPSDIEKLNGSFPSEIEDWLDAVIEGNVVRCIGGLGTTGVGILFDGAPGLGKTTHAVTTIMELIRRLPEADSEATANALGIDAQNYAQYANSLRPIYYLTYPEFLSRKKAIFEADQDAKVKMQLEMEGFHGRCADDRYNVRVLVLDDLGKEYKGAGFNDASFDEVLRSRYDKGLPTIVTTNVARENWGKQYGEAMGSFAFEAFHRVAILGKDHRKG
jgi:DNA replication protein DnaC